MRHGPGLWSDYFRGGATVVAMNRTMIPHASGEHTDPPPYSANSTGFPLGYFIIRNLATGKLLDVAEKKKDDGSELILYPEVESSIVLSFRDSIADNQVFFVDYLGNLCSKHSGHGIDVEVDGRIVLRHRRPMTSTFPNRYSHALPRFNYSPRTGHITLTFAHDPAYPESTHAQSCSDTWRNRTYLLTAIPAAKPRGLLDDAADFLVGATSALTSPLISVFSSKAFETSNTITDMQREGFELRDDELSEVDRLEETLDDSPDPVRRVKVIALSTDSERDIRTMKRRQWEVVPLLTNRAMTGAI